MTGRFERGGRHAAKMERMREVLRDLDRSGLTQRAFAERSGVPLSTLTWWRRRLGQSTVAVGVKVVVA